MSAPKRSLNELMQAVKANIRRLRASRPRREKSTNAMNAIDGAKIEFDTRIADQEVDAIEICPAHPEYMVIGTYSLLKTNDPRDYEGQTRRGTIQVMEVASQFKPKYTGMLGPQLDKISFPCAVLDIHFHPSDGTLLGVATSNSEMRFFRFVIHGDVMGRRVITRLLPLGVATVAENDSYGLVPLITQFAWFPEMRTRGTDDEHDVAFAITTSQGDTKVVKTTIAAIKYIFDPRLQEPSAPLAVISHDIHNHDLEAWTVAAITLRGPTNTVLNTSYHMILSGGDDSALVASAVELPSCGGGPDSPSIVSRDYDHDHLEVTPLPLWKERRIHGAGVVSILPLERLSVPVGNGIDQFKEIVPVVTGSYDETIRIFEVDPNTYRSSLAAQKKLNGGVWRVKVLDQYTTIGTGTLAPSVDGGDTRASAPDYLDPATRYDAEGTFAHTLLLVSLMHGGVAILRLTHATNPEGWPMPSPWTFTQLVGFRAGHESMVYSCDAILENPDSAIETPATAAHAGNPTAGNPTTASRPPTYTIVSTSFYDMKICTWKFVDHFKAEHTLRR